MATSGSFQKSLASGHYILKVEWSITQSVSNNTSTPTAKIYLINDYSISVRATSGHSLTINGVKYSFSSSAISSKGTHLIATINGNAITHNSDGTKSVNLSLSYKMDASLSGTYYGTVTASGTATFNTIARATTPTLSASSAYIGDNITITMNRASSSFTHTLVAKLGSQSVTIGTGLGTSRSWAIPTSLLTAIPNATSGTCTITCTTYNGSTSIGSKTVSLTLKVKDTVKPTVTFTVAEANNTVSGKGFTDFIQSLSKLLIKSTGKGAGGSTIKSYSVTAAGTTYSGSSVTTNTLASSGDITVTVKVTDSRGRTGSASQSINIKAYSKPKLSSFSVRRCNADGTSNDEGSYCKVTVSASVSAITGNVLTLDLDVAESRQSSGTTITLSNTGVSFNGSKIVSNINPDKSYVFAVTATDAFYPVTKAIPISTGATSIYVSADGTKVGIGKKCESSGFEVGFISRFYKDVYIQNTNGVFCKIPKTIGGRVLVKPTEANKPTKVSITFPEGLFTPNTTPFVVATPHSTSPGTLVQGVSVYNVTASGCDIYLTRSTIADTYVSWMAMEL